MREARLWVDGPARGAENMRRDVALLDECARGALSLAIRLYWFSPACLSLGRTQPWSDADEAACRRDGVDIVRRPSGGRAVLHDEEVTYAVVCRWDDPLFGGTVIESCARIHAAVARGLASIGVATSPHRAPGDARAAAVSAAASADCFAVPSAQELVDYRGRKLVGSAQCRRGGALLQHGSVLIGTSRAAAYLRSGGGRAGASLSDILGRPVARAEVLEALHAGFAEAVSSVLDTTA